MPRLELDPEREEPDVRAWLELPDDRLADPMDRLDPPLGRLVEPDARLVEPDDRLVVAGRLVALREGALDRVGAERVTPLERVGSDVRIASRPRLAEPEDERGIEDDMPDERDGLWCAGGVDRVCGTALDRSRSVMEDSPLDRLTAPRSTPLVERFSEPADERILWRDCVSVAGRASGLRTAERLPDEPISIVFELPVERSGGERIQLRPEPRDSERGLATRPPPSDARTPLLPARSLLCDALACDPMRPVCRDGSVEALSEAAPLPESRARAARLRLLSGRDSKRPVSFWSRAVAIRERAPALRPIPPPPASVETAAERMRLESRPSASRRGWLATSC